MCLSSPYCAPAANRYRCALTALLCALFSLPSAIARAQAPKPGSLPPAPVAVATVQMRKMTSGQAFVGTIEPLRVTTVGSPLADKVVKFPVKEGDRVKKDDVLAVLRIDRLEIELRAAEAELQLRSQELAELVNGSRPEEIKEAKAQLDAAAALNEYATRRLERTRRLVAQNAATADEFEEQTSAAEAAANNYQAKLSAWKLVSEGPRPEKIEQARARVAAQEEEVKKLQDDRDQHTILAPFDGYVTHEHTEVGQWIAVGSPVVDLVELDEVYVEVPVQESYIDKVAAVWAAKGKVPVRIDSMPGRSFDGVVERIVPRADERSRSFPVKVRVANQQEHGRPVLRPGMMAWATFPVGDQTEVTAVPKDALVLGQEQKKVWVVVDPEAPPPTHLRAVTVKVLRAEGDWVGVEGDLRPGQRVIIEGNERINPMQPIRIIDKTTIDKN